MSREGVFWGWGEAGAGPSLPDQAAGFLRSALGVEGAVVSRPVALEEVRLRDSALPGAMRSRLEAIVGEGHVRDDAAARVGRCRGKSYLDLLRQRAGDCDAAPDAVVAPGDATALAAALNRLLHDESLHAAMGLRGRERALGEFSLEAMGARTLAVYRRALPGLPERP